MYLDLELELRQSDQPALVLVCQIPEGFEILHNSVAIFHKHVLIGGVLKNPRMCFKC